MAKMQLQRGFTDGKSSIWLAQNFLRMKMARPGAFHITFLKSQKNLADNVQFESERGRNIIALSSQYTRGLYWSSVLRSMFPWMFPT